MQIKHKKVKNFITVTDTSNLVGVLRKVLKDKGVMCIFCENDRLFVQLQDVYVNNFSNNRNLKVLRSTKKLKEITDMDEALSIIKDEHLRNNHRGINEVFAELKSKYYFPRFMNLITKFINNCEVCQLAKFDRRPVKVPYQISESPGSFNDIAHMEIWFPFRNVMFLTTIDKLSKYATVHKLADRTWFSILSALKERIRFLGKMKKLVYDNDRCMLHEAVKLFLNENNIDSHVTTAHHKTGNADVERLHGTLNEHIRIITADRTVTDEDTEDKIHRIITIYNNTIHTTTKLRPIDFIEKNFDREKIQQLAEQFKKEKLVRTNKLNENRTENFDLMDSIVRNKDIQKNSLKYKRLSQFRKDGNYVTDTSNRRNKKYNIIKLK